MKNTRFGLNVLTIAVLTLACTSVASAAPRTWVSGTGSDANPCTRSSPCATFTGALAKTTAGGEINCVDAGDYGMVTIGKAITIDCAGTLGSILVPPGGDGITIEAGSSDVITLRNLSIDGAGGFITGGLVYHSAAA